MDSSAINVPFFFFVNLSLNACTLMCAFMMALFRNLVKLGGILLDVVFNVGFL